MRKALVAFSVTLGLWLTPHLALAADVNMILLTWLAQGEANSTLTTAQTIVGTFISMPACTDAASKAQVVNGQPALEHAFICVQAK